MGYLDDFVKGRVDALPPGLLCFLSLKSRRAFAKEVNDALIQ